MSRHLVAGGAGRTGIVVTARGPAAVSLRYSNVAGADDGTRVREVTV
ncbi:hypothetical protein ACFWIB_31520 [Streptomyces sp. NPDC127051]